MAIANTSGSNCSGDVHPSWDTMLRGVSDSDFPWLGFILGGVPTAIWYVCADQVGNKSIIFKNWFLSCNNKKLLSEFCSQTIVVMIVMVIAVV